MTYNADTFGARDYQQLVLQDTITDNAELRFRATDETYMQKFRDRITSLAAKNRQTVTFFREGLHLTTTFRTL
jgi:hypothetical protein